MKNTKNVSGSRKMFTFKNENTEEKFKVLW